MSNGHTIREFKNTNDIDKACGHFNIETLFNQYRDHAIKIRPSYERLIFILGIPIPDKSLYIETGPWFPGYHGHTSIPYKLLYLITSPLFVCKDDLFSSQWPPQITWCQPLFRTKQNIFSSRNSNQPYSGFVLLKVCSLGDQQLDGLLNTLHVAMSAHS